MSGHYLSHLDSEFVYLTNNCSNQIYQSILKNEPYDFEYSYTKNEIASVCMHITGRMDAMLQALYLMQAETKTKRLGYVLEAYWALSQSYLVLNLSKTQKHAVVSVDSLKILECLNRAPKKKLVIELTDAFLDAVHTCKLWSLEGRSKPLSALGLIKRILDYQLQHPRSVYLFFKDNAEEHGLKRKDIQSLLTPFLTLDFNQLGTASTRRLSVISLRILNRLRVSPAQSKSVLVFNLSSPYLAEISLRKSSLRQQLKGLSYAFYFSSTQLAKEIKAYNSFNDPLSLRGVKAECGKYDASQLISRIKRYGMLSEKILAWTDEKVMSVHGMNKEKRYINRCVRLCARKESLTASRLLEEHQKHWKEGVYLSTLLYSDSKEKVSE